MCCTSWRLERIENNVWIRLARSKRSGAIEGRPRREIAPGNRLHIGQDGVDQHPYRPGTAKMVLTSGHNQLNVIANLYINIIRIERNEEMAKFIKNLALKIPLSSSLCFFDFI